MTLSNHTIYSGLTCYSFRNCSKFLFQSLVNDSLNLSSPTTFNDIFDCPIIELMNNDVQQYYKETIKKYKEIIDDANKDILFLELKYV